MKAILTPKCVLGRQKSDKKTLNIFNSTQYTNLRHRGLPINTFTFYCRSLSHILQYCLLVNWSIGMKLYNYNSTFDIYFYEISGILCHNISTVSILHNMQLIHTESSRRFFFRYAVIN